MRILIGRGDTTTMILGVSKFSIINGNTLLIIASKDEIERGLFSINMLTLGGQWDNVTSRVIYASKNHNTLYSIKAMENNVDDYRFEIHFGEELVRVYDSKDATFPIGR